MAGERAAGAPSAAAPSLLKPQVWVRGASFPARGGAVRGGGGFMRTITNYALRITH